jgi:hypothetical protein
VSKLAVFKRLPILIKSANNLTHWSEKTPVGRFSRLTTDKKVNSLSGNNYFKAAKKNAIYM